MAAYTDIQVSRQIYISSSYDYFVEVSYKHQQRWWTRTYFITAGGLMHLSGMGWFNVPHYVMREIDSQLLELMRSGRVIYHEYDRDGNKRFTDFRYHSPETVERIMSRLERKLSITP